MRRAEPSSCHSGVILHGSHAVLLCFCVVVMLQFLSRTPVLLAFPPPPPLLLFDLSLPQRLAAPADALSGMIHTDLLLLLLPAFTHDSLPT
jgi:hypothetical protein